MDRLPSLSKQAFIERMRGEVERVLDAVAEAVNQAPTGQLITASEEKVRDLLLHLFEKFYFYLRDGRVGGNKEHCGIALAKKIERGFGVMPEC